MTASKYTVYLLAIGGFVSGVSMRLAEPLLPRVASDFGTSLAQTGVLITGFTVAYGLFQLAHGPIGDRLGKLRAIAIAMALASVASWACSTATNISELALYRFFTGMTAGAVIPLAIAFVGDNVPYGDRQRVLGQFMAGTFLGSAMGPLVGGVFGDYFGWRMSFLVPAIAYLSVAVLLGPTARREPRPELAATPYRPIQPFVDLFRSRNVRVICGTVAAEACLFYGAFGFLGAYLRYEFSLSFTMIGFILMGFGIGALTFSATVASLIKRVGPRHMVTASGRLLLVCFGLLTWLPVWWLAIPVVCLLGFSFYLFHNTLQTRATEMAPATRGTAIAAFAFCLFTGQAVGVAVSGIFVEALGISSRHGHCWHRIRFPYPVIQSLRRSSLRDSRVQGRFEKVPILRGLPIGISGVL